MERGLIQNLMLVLLIAASSAFGNTIMVSGGGSAIQEAINSASGGDIVVVAPGTYNSINFNGKHITVVSSNPDDPNIVAATIIDAGGTGSTVTFASGEGRDSVLQGFTVTGGTGTQHAVVNWSGGGIFCLDSSPTIMQNIITGNHVATDGGGVFSGSSGFPLLLRNQITNNYANRGGGIYGAVAVELNNNIISGNSASQGGGLYLRSSISIVKNNLVYDNTADYGAGGGVYLRGADNSVVTGNTIVSNSSVIDGANLDVQWSNNVTITNNIIVNALGGGGVYLYNATVSFKYNNVYNNAGGNYVGMPEATGIDGNISVNTLFVNSDVNDYHLQATSPCIDVGDPAFAGGPDEMDIDGQPRVLGGRVDIGADEYVSYTNPVADAGPDQFFDEIALVTLDGTGSSGHDPCDVLTYHWSQVGGPSVFLSDPCSVQPTFMPEIEGEYRFELVVSDGMFTSFPDEVIIAVGNCPPVADAGPNSVCQVGERVYLDGSGSYDPDPEDELTYFWTQTEGPNVVLEGANTPRPYFEPNEEGLYVFELVVSDGFEDSEPSVMEMATITVTTKQEDLVFDIQEYNHCGDVWGNRVIFAHGAASPRGWDIECKDLETGEVFGFSCDTTVHRIDAHPRIYGDIVVWFGGDPDFPSEIYVRNITTAVQKTLRQSASRSYVHPAISGKRVIWVEHFNVNPSNPFDTSPFSICGADISNFGNPTYFTVAENVGSAVGIYCYGCYHYDFDSRVDISGNFVVWEAEGDIYGADISDLNDIKTFAICTDPARQYDPAISGNIVVWTDERNDGGDIYGADISDLANIKVFGLVRADGTQEQPAIDGSLIVYVTDGFQGSEIRVCCLTKRHGAIDIELSGNHYGMGPAIDGETIVWQDDYKGKAHGMTLEVSYSIVDGTVKNVATGKRYDYIQHSVNTAANGDEIVVYPETYYGNINFHGKTLKVRSANPTDPSVVAATLINGWGRGPAVTFESGEGSSSVLRGFTIQGAAVSKNNSAGGNLPSDIGTGSGAIVCFDLFRTGPVISDCVVTGNDCAGLYCYRSGPTVINCTFTGNDSNGVELQGRSLAKFTNCTIVGNGAHGVFGGYPTVTNCTIVGNMLSAIASYTPNVRNCILWDNASGDEQGQQIIDLDGSGSVTYSNVQGGWAGQGNIDADPCFTEMGC
ncbi:MAG: right-handed parallel beta-helix repeat-containing protein, partial [Planctomycetota bacterium]